MIPSQEDVLKSAARSECYIGHDNVVSNVDWSPAPDNKSEFVTPAGPNNTPPNLATEPATLSGVFMVGDQGCYVAADLGIDVDHPIQWQLEKPGGLQAVLAEGKASCLLTAVPPCYPLLHAEYPKYMKHLEQIRKKCLPLCSHTGAFSKEQQGRPVLKVSHDMYEPRESSENPSDKQTTPEQESGAGNDSGSILSKLDLDRKPEYRTPNLPVSPGVRPLLENIAPKYRFNPLVARMYDREDPILPAEYVSRIRGAIVEARFTLSHKFITTRSNGKSSHFIATIDELIILGRPPKIDVTPCKLRHKRLFAAVNDMVAPSNSSADETSPKSLDQTPGAGPSKSVSGSHHETSNTDGLPARTGTSADASKGDQAAEIPQTSRCERAAKRARTHK
ncbi:hypothetical protein FRC08_011020 [Ceratobasidium sp. 394]|nr:hypothetical protein FRC08_011020 [Ceratobasidium sp. 394]